MKKDYEIADHRLLLDMAIFWTEIDSPVTLFALSYNSPTMSAWLHILRVSLKLKRNYYRQGKYILMDLFHLEKI